MAAAAAGAAAAAKVAEAVAAGSSEDWGGRIVGVMKAATRDGRCRTGGIRSEEL